MWLITSSSASLRFAPLTRLILRQITLNTTTSSTTAAAFSNQKFKMANAYRVHVPASDTGLIKFDQTESSAAKVSELLQNDIESHHVFFNDAGFHNHIPHHLLTLYGTGATPGTLQTAYNTNASHQLPAQPPHLSILHALQTDYATAAPKYFGTGSHYSSFLTFYQSEIAKKGWKDVVREYIFGGTPVSDDLCSRLYSGFLHPMIQLMFAIEWEQPALVACAMAQAAVHNDRLTDFLARAEKMANSRADGDAAGVHYLDMFDGLAARRKKSEDGDDDVLVRSARWTDPNRVFDGVMVRAPGEAMEYVSRIKVRSEDLEERTAEMMHGCAFVAAAASWHPPNIPKMDFFLIHHHNSTPIFKIFNNTSWIPRLFKVRLLEWKMRLDVIQYIARGCPPLKQDILKTYQPRDIGIKKPLVSKPEDLLPRFHTLKDDGHIIKVVRALLIAEDEMKEHGDKEWVRIWTKEEWLMAHYLLLDSVEGGEEPTWVRSAGFPEAWENVAKVM